jgi:hypothetical protein
MSKPASEPGVVQWMIRRATTISSTESAADEPPLIEQKYYAYNDLTWERLEKWLTDAFPGQVFTSDKVSQLRI